MTDNLNVHFLQAANDKFKGDYKNYFLTKYCIHYNLILKFEFSFKEQSQGGRGIEDNSPLSATKFSRGAKKEGVQSCGNRKIDYC